MERFKERTGFHVAMGRVGDRVSYESSRYGQRVLKYALCCTDDKKGYSGAPAASAMGAWSCCRRRMTSI